MHFEEVKGVVVESLQKVKKWGILCFVEDSPAMWFMRQFKLAIAIHSKLVFLCIPAKNDQILDSQLEYLFILMCLAGH